MSSMVTYAMATAIVNTLTSISLGLYIIARNPKPLTNRTFGMFTLCVGAYSLSYVIWLLAKEEQQGLFWIRMVMMGCIPIPTLFLHFVACLLDKAPEKTRAIVVAYSFTAATLLANTTSLVIQNVQQKLAFPFWGNPGPLFHIYTVQFTICAFLAHYWMHRELKTATGNQREQIKYVFVGTLPAFLGGSTNFFLWYDIPIPPVGNIAISFYVAMVAYAILRNQLMDIRIVIKKSLVYSVLVTLLTVGYFGLVYAVERSFQSSMGYSSRWLSLSAFALMALVFQPLKIGIQRLVDWIIFRVPQEELVKRMERLEEQALQAEKFKAVSTLAAGMAHEIKNPLTALLTFTEFIPERHKDPEFIKKLHEIFSSETRRIQGIVQELLEFSKPKPPHPRPVEIGRLIESTLDLLAGDLIKRGIKYSVSCGHDGVQAQADPDQMRQVFMNLIQNAADAMPEGGSLEFHTRIVEGCLEIRVTDTGHGIPKHLLAKIFDPFVTTKPAGTGLGLAVVYSILQQHHGTIRAENRPDGGAVFTLRLPVAEP